MRLIQRMPLVCCAVMLSLLPISAGRAAITLGAPFGGQPLIDPCSPSDPYMLVEVTSVFDILVTNCSGDDAAALVQMFYTTPGGVRSNEDHYGMDERRIEFDAFGNVARNPAEPGKLAGVVGKGPAAHFKDDLAAVLVGVGIDLAVNDRGCRGFAETL